MQDRNIWVKYMDNWMNVHENRGVSLYIISDVRFKNEYEFVKNNKTMGIIVKVIAPKRNEDRLLKESRGDMYVYEKISNHASECDLDDYNNEKYDMVIENDTTDIVIIEELQYKFERLLYEAYLNLAG